MGELTDALLDVSIPVLYVTEAEEEDEPDWSLQQLQHAVNQDPVPQGPITESTRCPVHGQEDATWYRYQHTGDAAEEHHYLDKPCGLFRVLLHHVQERVRIVSKVL